MFQMVKPVKLFLIILLTLAMTACTNNQWFLSTLYNRADNTVYSEIVDYADFDESQRREIKILINQYHHWHRTTQLPRYADFLQSLSDRVYVKDVVTIGEVYTWAQQIEDFVHDINDCHPLLSATAIMKNLSNEQVEQISIYSREEYENALKKYRKRSPDERFEKRYRNILKWFSRFQLDINESERMLLRETMEAEPKLREESFALWLAWDQRFYELMLLRSEVDFADLMEAHVLSLKTMLRDSYEEKLNYKLDLWVQFFQVVAQEELDGNHYGFAEWAEKMSRNLRAISQSVPAKQSDWDALAYCKA